MAFQPKAVTWDASLYFFWVIISETLRSTWSVPNKYGEYNLKGQGKGQGKGRGAEEYTREEIEAKALEHRDLMLRQNYRPSAVNAIKMERQETASETLRDAMHSIHIEAKEEKK